MYLHHLGVLNLYLQKKVFTTKKRIDYPTSAIYTTSMKLTNDRILSRYAYNHHTTTKNAW